MAERSRRMAATSRATHLATLAALVAWLGYGVAWAGHLYTFYYCLLAFLTTIVVGSILLLPAYMKHAPRVERPMSRGLPSGPVPSHQCCGSTIN